MAFFSAVTSANMLPIGMMRVEEEKRGKFIPVESIIRGAYLNPDYDMDDHYFVNDLMDNDIFLRLQLF